MTIVLEPDTEKREIEIPQIAEVVYEAATDGKDQLRYVAGADAKAMYETRMQLGEEAFRKSNGAAVFGEAKAA